MLLSDRDIKKSIEKGSILIDPFYPECIQPASIDVHLGSNLVILKDTLEILKGHPKDNELIIDPYKNNSNVFSNKIFKDGLYSILPGQFLLGTTTECLTLPDNIAARVEGKSSLGRLGLLIHATAGFIDPGWSGCITLELYNATPYSIILHENMAIAQFCFLEMSSSVEKPYGSDGLNSKYQGQTQTTASKYYLNK